ncbi:MAG: CheR family methyltransferase [Thermoanaerobaculaceae bacterium]
MKDPSAAVARLASLIERVSGNVIQPGHFPFLAETARQRAASLRIAGVPEYVQALEEGGIPGEWSALLPHITVKESFLFRHPQHFAALSRWVLPQLAAARREQRTLRVWSAGCARGEEPATLAIVLAGCPEVAGWECRVLATDVDEQALAAAREGLFGDRAVAQVPAELRSRFFARRGDLFELSPEIARRIEYRTLNLVQELLPVDAASFDLIFLRNVLIYFRPESQRRVAGAVARALAPDGVLFLGPAETLWQLSGELEAVDLGDCFCYRHAVQPGVRGPGSVVRGETAPRQLRPGGEPHETAAVRIPEATARPEERTPAFPHRDAATAEGAPPAGAAPVPGLTGTRQRLADAILSLAEDRLDRAADLVDQALVTDPSDPAVHALEGFLHEVSGRTQMAVASYRAALFLDPGLFQVRLLLADSLRRLGHEQRAAIEFREVMAGLAAGTVRSLDSLAGLQLPGTDQAAQRCRVVLLERTSRDDRATPPLR